MDARQLRYFSAVYERRNLSHAAEECNVAQSAISSHIKNLELELGVVLFKRLSRGMEPTPAGMRLYEHARVILRSMRAAVEDVHQFSEIGVGSIDLGLPFSLVQSIGVQFLSAVKSEFPNAKFVIHEGLSSELQRQLLEGAIDIAYCYNAASHEHIISREILNEEMMCVGLPEIVGEDRSPIEFDHVTKLPRILLRRGAAARSISTQGRILNRLYEDAAIELNSVIGLRNAVLAGVGVAVCPYITMADLIESKVVVARSIQNPTLIRTLFCLRSSNRLPTVLMEKIINLIDQTIESEVAAGRWPLVQSRDLERSDPD